MALSEAEKKFCAESNWHIADKTVAIWAARLHNTPAATPAVLSAKELEALEEEVHKFATYGQERSGKGWVHRNP